jgi:hypothetical protein
VERYNGGDSCTTAQREWIPAARHHARGTSFANAHMTFGPLNRIGNRKRRSRVLPIQPDREVKVHPPGSRVKLATDREMRHPRSRRQRGDAAHRAPSPCSPCRGCFDSTGKKLLSIVGSARRARSPATLRQLGHPLMAPARAPACPEHAPAPPATTSTESHRPTYSQRAAGAARTSWLCPRH